MTGPDQVISHDILYHCNHVVRSWETPRYRLLWREWRLRYKAVVCPSRTNQAYDVCTVWRIYSFIPLLLALLVFVACPEREPKGRLYWQYYIIITANTLRLAGTLRVGCPFTRCVYCVRADSTHKPLRNNWYRELTVIRSADGCC